MAKCAKVAIKEHKPCAQNMEAARVFSTFLKGNSKWMSDFQKSWKCGSKMPIAITKKISAKRESSKCSFSTGKCVDNVSILKNFVEQFKLPKASTCATLYELIDEEYGFSCKQSLKSLVGKDVRLSDACCATCKK